RFPRRFTTSSNEKRSPTCHADDRRDAAGDGVWVDYDGKADRVLVNIARGRRKEKNVDRSPNVGLSMVDPDDPYRFVSVQGEVDGLTEGDAIEHANRLAQRYMDVEEYPGLDDGEGARVQIRIRPTDVVTSGK